MSVRASVGRSVCPVHCGKTADRIRMPFRTGLGMRQVVGFGDRSTKSGTFGANFGRAIITNGDYTAYMCDSATTRPSSQITLGKLVKYSLCQNENTGLPWFRSEYSTLKLQGVMPLIVLLAVNFWHQGDSFISHDNLSSVKAVIRTRMKCNKGPYFMCSITIKCGLLMLVTTPCT